MANDRRPVVEQEDRYVLPLDGRNVSRCFVDYNFWLCFFDDGPHTEIRIEGEMRLVSNGHEVLFGPGSGPDPRSLGPLLILFGKSVIWAHAFKNGALKILFAGDLLLEVFPFEQYYEAWELLSKDGLKLVSLPGGSIAYWKSLDS